MLNDLQITTHADSNLIVPFSEELLQPHSYDATLDSIIKIATYNPFTKERGWLLRDLSKEDVELEHGDFALASTVEVFTLPQTIVGFVQGKSSVGRNGLQIENAGLIDAGFSGAITLELYNMAPWPIKLTKGMSICQIHFTPVEAPRFKNYSKTGHYNGQRGPTTAVYAI
ncbi:dCTP deaminase [Acinetobacter sp.]|uniref:dCTP deaminase n=1 Tax=Acinetobacter sp. TaxID=472 RepID=UPI003752897A